MRPGGAPDAAASEPSVDTISEGYHFLRWRAATNTYSCRNSLFLPPRASVTGSGDPYVHQATSGSLLRISSLSPYYFPLSFFSSLLTSKLEDFSF